VAIYLEDFELEEESGQGEENNKKLVSGEGSHNA